MKNPTKTDVNVNTTKSPTIADKPDRPTKDATAPKADHTKEKVGDLKQVIADIRARGDAANPADLEAIAAAVDGL